MDEKSVVERMIELGLGIAAYGEDKVAEFVREVSARGEDKKKDVQEKKEELKEKAAAFRKAFEKRVRCEVESVMKRMNLVNRQEMENLEKRIEELEKKLSEKES